MANVVTREFRHLRKERGGKALVSSLHNRKAIQLAARRIAYVAWPVATTTFSTNAVIYEIEYRMSADGHSLQGYQGRVLDEMILGVKTFNGAAIVLDYRLSDEYRKANSEIIRVRTSYGTRDIGTFKDLPVAGSTSTINTETVYDKSGKPIVLYTENKNDWLFKNDVETDFDR